MPRTAKSWKGQGRILPWAFRGNMALLTLWFHTCSLHNSERMNSSSSHPVVITHSHSPRKLIQPLSLQRPTNSSQMLTTELFFFSPKLQPIWVSSFVLNSFPLFQICSFLQEVDAFSVILVNMLHFLYSSNYLAWSILSHEGMLKATSMGFYRFPSESLRFI